MDPELTLLCGAIVGGVSFVGAPFTTPSLDTIAYSLIFVAALARVGTERRWPGVVACLLTYSSYGILEWVAPLGHSGRPVGLGLAYALLCLEAPCLEAQYPPV
jgi:hypothetical protein